MGKWDGYELELSPKYSLPVDVENIFKKAVA
jgi:hypothetical protein